MLREINLMLCHTLYESFIFCFCMWQQFKSMEWTVCGNHCCSDFFFFKLIYFDWRLITLQYCSGFCHTLIWIGHGYPCVPHPEHPSHLPPHPIPQGHPSAPAPSHPVLCIKPGLVIFFTYDNICVSMLFSQIIPPSPSPTESKSLFFTSLSLLLSRI